MANCTNLKPIACGGTMGLTLAECYRKAMIPKSDCLKTELVATPCDVAPIRITLESEDFEYDGEPHSITAVTNPSDNVVIEYSTDGGETWSTEVPEFTDVGDYPIKARAKYIDGENYYYADGLLAIIPAVSPTCFIEGTKVWTADGTKNIEDIEQGDIILAYNDLTESVAEASVLNTMSDEVDAVYRISVGTDTIEVTGQHQMYLPIEARYEEVDNLEAGDELLCKNGEMVSISDIELIEGEFIVYNLEVDEYSNFYVGEQGLLTYNMNIADENGFSAIRLTPLQMSLQSVQNSIATLNLACVQYIDAAPGVDPSTVSFEYVMSRMGQAPKFVNEDGDEFIFTLTGHGSHIVPVQLELKKAGEFVYYIKSNQTPTPQLVPATKEYYVAIWVNDALSITRINYYVKQSMLKNDAMVFETMARG